MLKLNKFYRYLIYRVSHFENLTPVMNTLFALSVTHTFVIATIFIIIAKALHYEYDFIPSRLEAFLIFSVVMLIHYILFYDKKKWKEYEEEFKNETPKDRKVGLIKVLIYLIGSIAAFFIFMMVTFEQK